MRSLAPALTSILLSFGLTVSAAPPRVPDVATAATALTATTTTATSHAAVRATADLRAFDRLLAAAGLRHRLRRADRRYTVLAPTNAAVARVPARIRVRMFQAGNAAFRHLMATHLVAGDVDLTRVPSGTVLTTLSGETLRVDRQPDGSVLLNGVYRVETVQQTANGHVYSLDRMVAPVR